MRTKTTCTRRPSCTDNTDNRTDGTQSAGIIPRVIPRTIPRPRHSGRHAALPCAEQASPVGAVDNSGAPSSRRARNRYACRVMVWPCSGQGYRTCLLTEPRARFGSSQGQTNDQASDAATLTEMSKSASRSCSAPCSGTTESVHTALNTSLTFYSLLIVDASPERA